MGQVKIRFLKGTNNIARVALTVDEAAFTDLASATRVMVHIGDLEIDRPSGSANGVDWDTEGAAGILLLDPAAIPEAAALVDGTVDGYVRVFDPTHPQGQVFGGEDSVDRLKFDVSIPPS